MCSKRRLCHCRYTESLHCEIRRKPEPLGRNCGAGEKFCPCTWYRENHLLRKASRLSLKGKPKCHHLRSANPLPSPPRQVGGLREGQDPSEEFPAALPGRGREGRSPPISTVPPGFRLTALRQHHAGARRRAARCRPPPPPQLFPARRGGAAPVAVRSGRDARAEPQRPPGLQGGLGSATLRELQSGVPQPTTGSGAGAEGYRQGRRGDGQWRRAGGCPQG